MLNQLDLTKVLFLDIETVPLEQSYQNLESDWKELWDRKASYLRRAEETEDELYQRAGIYAEFGKVICISLGFLVRDGGNREFRVKSIYGHDEKELLIELSEVLNRFYKGPDYLLCAHNGKEFDFPYLSRRMLINSVTLPHLLDIAGRKPWEVQHLDTMQLWKFGDFKHYTSLKLLCKLFGIESPKTDLDGSKVAETYYKDGDLERIREYCQEDMIAVAQLMIRYKGEKALKRKEIEFLS